MQAALMIRSKKRIARRRRLRREGRLYDLPSNVSVKQLQPFPQYPPDQWVGDLDTSCAQGRSAWQLERGRRCSVSENPASCHRRWVKRNRIHDSSLGSSDDDDFLGALRGPSSFANAFLYVGLGTVALGLVIVFVGTGEKGFKTVELRLIGPSLIGIGLLCCILRIFFCICPSNCISSNRRKMKQKNAKVDVDHTTSLLCADNKRVSIARTAQTQYPQEALDFLKKHPNSKMNEGMETLREIATTSLFLQSEKNNFTSAIDPRKNEEKLEVISISDEEENGALVKLNHNFHGTASILDAAIKTPDTSFVLEPVREEQTRPNKLSRSRAPLNQQKCKNTSSTKIVLSTMDETSLTSTGHNENDVGYASTTLSLVPSQPLVPSLLVDGNSLALNRMDTIKPTQASTTQSVVTSFASSFEPELVLSPAKLGQ
ncbi:uncharacterized protein LOC129570210 isoform X2 [Sitodiplosis mosellana]|uniref:uncharacterized protein LOC129570210 isoform X2 n=1 Tax=Sitodiplosis mosellana TaxID=263140 RepID=UPI0024450673|nr:uncharacterized protein LOC129570210 isoform X2 [Sitodiplosis mosellana]